MGQQIIKQPNGLFAIFSSNVDAIVGWDYTEEDVLEHFVERAADETRRTVRRLLDHVKADNPREAYYHGGTVALDYAAEQSRVSTEVEQEKPR